MGRCIVTDKRAIPQEIADMIRRGRDSQKRQEGMRKAIQLLTDAFLSIGASLTECADVCEGERARLHLQYEQKKLAERKAKR